MIDPDKRKAIYLLYKEGVGIKSISRQLSVTRKTVKSIIEQNGETPQTIRKDKMELDEALLRRLYADCDGFIQRVHEKLTEEEGIIVGYSTLSRILRAMGLGQVNDSRCGQVEDKIGDEMQHDTSPYTIEIRGKKRNVVASLVYYRYSKVRYLRFYRFFNRFKMKSFLHEALSFYEHCAPVCIIDNTNLARLRGTGKNAVIVPEMEQFAKQYGFRFICHEIKHHNRKAGNERGFYTTETNFFPGRTFASLEDLNRQAFNWATSKFAQRPLSKIGAIPARLFEQEKPYLKKLPPFVPTPYLAHQRVIDQYGYASFEGNFYWVPGTKRHDVTLLQYDNCIKVYHNRKLMGEYEPAPDGARNTKILPKDGQKPVHQPKFRKKPTAREEKKLRSVSQEVDSYLTFVIKEKRIRKHRFIRQLHGIYRKVAGPLFIKAISRALQYRVQEIETIERIVVLLMKEGNTDPVFSTINYEFQQRPAFIEGCYSDDVDLTVYDKPLED